MNAHDIRSKIEQRKNELQALPTPSLAQIEGQIQYHSARAIVGADAERHKVELEMAINAKSEAERVLEKRSELQNELARLNQDLQMAEEFERVSKAREASDQCTLAYNEYVAASKQVVRAFRRVLAANQRAYNIKGAVTAPEDYGLHLPAIYSPYWTGTVGDHMRQGLMPFEQSEKEASQ